MNLQLLPNSVFLQPEFSTTAVPIALGGSGTMALQSATNVATLTFTSAHGYTSTKQSNGTYLIQNTTTGHGPTPYDGSTLQSPWTYFWLTGATGVTAVNGVIFAILSVPSTTTMTIWCTQSGTNPTVTAASFVPIFVPSYGTYNTFLGANCTVQYNPDNTGAPFVPPNSAALPTPTFRTLVAASAAQQVEFEGAGQTVIVASGSAGTSRWSLYAR